MRPLAVENPWGPCDPRLHLLDVLQDAVSERERSVCGER